jgi:hypothetical protein
MEDVLSFCAWVMAVSMLVGVSVWFCCSIVEGFMKMRRGLKRPGYHALVKRNKRLKRLLSAAAQENVRLRKGYHTDILPRKGERISRNVT